MEKEQLVEQNDPQQEEIEDDYFFSGEDDNEEDGNEEEGNEEEPNNSENEGEEKGKNDAQKEPKKVEEKTKELSPQEKREAFKRRREEKERKRLEEIRKTEQKHYEEGIIKGAGGINKFTGEKLLDKFDIEEYTLMLEMSEKGLDPTNTVEYAKYVKEKRREEVRQQELKQSAELQKQEFVTQDIKNFQKEYPDVDIRSLLQEKNFADLFGDLVGKVELSSLYKKYGQIINVTENEADKKARNKLAKALSNPGALATKDGEEEIKPFSQMTDAEFDRFVEEAKMGKYSRNY